MARRSGLQFIALLVAIVVVATACADLNAPTAERESLVLLKRRFQDPGDRNYECLQATPERSPLTDKNGAWRIKEQRGKDFWVANCPDREDVDADYACEDWIEAQGCKLQTLFHTSQPGEKVNLYGCAFPVR